jgi:hypothetical protein
MKKHFTLSGAAIIIFLFVFTLLLTGCANKEIVTECLKGQTYGFWAGLWHGIIAPIDLIAMLWRDDVSVFASNNNGAWYAFGFMIGSGGWGFFGGNRASKSFRKN